MCLLVTMWSTSTAAYAKFKKSHLRIPGYCDEVYVCRTGCVLLITFSWFLKNNLNFVFGVSDRGFLITCY